MRMTTCKSAEEIPGLPRTGFNLSSRLCPLNPFYVVGRFPRRIDVVGLVVIEMPMTVFAQRVLDISPRVRDHKPVAEATKHGIALPECHPVDQFAHVISLRTLPKSCP